MKKRLLILGMIFTMAVSSAGCGSSSSSDNAGKTDKQTAAVQDSQKDTSSNSKSDKKDTNYKSADEITMDDLMSHDETPAEDFEFNDSADEIVIQKYVGKDPIVVIPDEIDGKKVVGFESAFSLNNNIVAVKIGNNIQEVAKSAFSGCKQLKYVVMGDSVKTIGGGVFDGTNLQELVLNDGLQKVGSDDYTYFLIPPTSNWGMDLKIPESVTELHVSEFNLIGKSGSYAEQYANEHADAGVTFTAE